jgi:hypothetical protein
MSFNDLIDNINIDLEKNLLLKKEETGYEDSFYEKLSLNEYEEKINLKLNESKKYFPNPNRHLLVG